MLYTILLSPTDIMRYGVDEIEKGNIFWGVIVIIFAIAGVAYLIFGYHKDDKPKSQSSSSSLKGTLENSISKQSNYNPQSAIKNTTREYVTGSHSTPIKEETAIVAIQESNTPEGCLPIGSRLAQGRYLIKDFISSGGFGNTYLAFDTVRKQDVAIKELYKRDICSRYKDTGIVSVSIGSNRPFFDDLKAKFVKEANRLMLFNHKNIVKVHEVFNENQTSYYTMDYIAGKSLKDVVKERGPLSEAEVLGIMPGILSALKTVHRQNIWHLDLKPANIILKNSKHPVLIDFGASKQYVDKDGNSLHSSSAMAHTPGFAPMEQLDREKKRIGPWTDVYGLGATLYALLAGTTPPDPNTIMEDGLDLPAHLSAKIRSNIETMMAVARKNRPQSVEEVEALFN